VSVKKVKNVSDGILRRHDFAWRFVLRSRSGIVEQHGATASVDRSLGSCVCYPQEREKKNDKQSNAGGRCGFITRVFHSAILSSRARRRNDWRWIFIIRDNNSSHFIDICGISTFGLFKVKDIGAIRHEKLYDKLISHIYHAAKRKLESLPKALIYLLDILRCLIF